MQKIAWYKDCRVVGRLGSKYSSYICNCDKDCRVIGRLGINTK